MALTGDQIRSVAGPFLIEVAHWARDHVAWLIGGSVLGASVVKLAAVSRGNQQTMFTLLGTADLTQVGLGTVVLVAPGGLMISFALLVFTTVRYVATGPRSWPVAAGERSAGLARAIRLLACAVALGVVGALLAALTSVLHFAGAVVFSVTLAPFLLWATKAPDPAAQLTAIDRWLFRHARLATGGFTALVAIGTAVLTLGVLASVLDDTVWLPAESVSRPGEPAWTGYRLGTHDDLIVYLRDADRTIERVPREVAATARLCTPRDAIPSVTLVQLVRGERYPVRSYCPPPW